MTPLAFRGISVVLASVLVFSAAGCCKAIADATKNDKSSTARRGTVDATKSGANVGRGIVRASPSFTATEVARLENGTDVAIVGEAPGGWLHVRWPYPSGGNVGYIHHDVVRELALLPVLMLSFID